MPSYGTALDYVGRCHPLTSLARVLGSKIEGLTLNLPSRNALEIFQKLGREDSITSEMFFTIFMIACHAS